MATKKKKSTSSSTANTTKDAPTTGNNIEEVPAVLPTMEQMKSSEEKYLENRAKRQGRVLTPEQEQEVKANYQELNTKLQNTTKQGEVAANYFLKKSVRPQKHLQQHISYEAARIEFKYIIDLQLYNQDKVYQQNGNNNEVIKHLLKYFINDPTGKIDLKKSIYLYGPLGCGKDFLMKCFKILLDGIEGYESFTRIPTVDIYEQVKSRKKAVPAFYNDHYCFTDLGYEPKLAYKTGEVPIMDHILFKRHEIATNGYLRTHITTNYKPEDLAILYNQRIRDRAKEMWKAVFLNGPSLR